MRAKIRLDWFKKYGVWQLSTPHLTFFKSNCTCIALCLTLFTIEIWIGSKENIKNII